MTSFCSRRSAQGFSLVELMVCLGLIALLMGLAQPSYKSYVHKARRTEAISHLIAVQLAQERLRAWRTAYAQLLSDPDLAQPETTPSGHYRLTLSPLVGDAYAVKATPHPSSPQADDGDCQELGLLVQAGRFTPTAKGRDGRDTTSQCWPA